MQDQTIYFVRSSGLFYKTKQSTLSDKIIFLCNSVTKISYARDQNILHTILGIAKEQQGYKDV